MVLHTLMVSYWTWWGEGKLYITIPTEMILSVQRKVSTSVSMKMVLLVERKISTSQSQWIWYFRLREKSQHHSLHGYEFRVLSVEKKSQHHSPHECGPFSWKVSTSVSTDGSLVWEKSLYARFTPIGASPLWASSKLNTNRWGFFFFVLNSHH